MNKLFNYMFFLLMVGYLCLVSCTGDGTELYSTWKKCSHPLDFFSFYYISPPWAFAKTSTDEHVVMNIDPFKKETKEGLGARVWLEAYIAKSSCSELLFLKTNDWKNKDYKVIFSDSHDNYQGQEGWLLHVSKGEVFAFSYLISSKEECAVLDIISNDFSMYKDIEFLIDGFSVSEK